MTYREAQRQLRAVGAVIKRTKGSHQQWTHPAWSRDVIVVVNSKGSMSYGVSNSIRQAISEASA